MVLQSQVRVDGQLYNIETKMTPSQSITGSLNAKSLDSLNKELLDKTIRTIDAIHNGQPIAADSIISSSLVTDLMKSSMDGLPNDIVNNVNDSLRKFLSDIAVAGNINDISLDKKVGL